MATEMRRIEDKMDARNLHTELIIIRMSNPPASKKVPLQFYAWLIRDFQTKDENVFADCQLLADKPLSAK